MKAPMRVIFTALLLAIITLFCACDRSPEYDDGSESIVCDGYTLTVKGSVLTKIYYHTAGEAVQVTIPEGITEIDPFVGRMLLNSVSLTIPSTLKEFSYRDAHDLDFLNRWAPKLTEIYDLSPHFDFDLENAQYSQWLNTSLKIIHHSAKEPSRLVKKDGFIFYVSADETIVLGAYELKEALTVPAYYEETKCTLAPYAFANCTKTRTVTLSEGITTISQSCFRWSGLEKVVIPSSVITVEKEAFSANEKLTDVHFSDGLKRIENGAFTGCKALTSLSFPDTLAYLGAFTSSVTDLNIPRSLEYIEMSDGYTHLRLPNLTSITVHPDNPYYSVKDGVLFNKEQTAVIMYPETKKDISYTVPSTVKEISNYAFYGNRSLKNVIFCEEGLERIAHSAFSCCSNLTEISIPKTVSEISVTAFIASGLTNVAVHPDNPYFSSVDGVLFNHGVTELILYPAERTERKYTVPSTVTAIGEQAFSRAYDLEEIILPEGLLSIGERAFDSGNKLTMSFPNSLEYIGKNAFQSCDLTLTWNYTGDWIATQNETEVILTKESFDNLNSTKYDYLIRGDYVLRKKK